jgi:hypothetical protein
MMAVVTGALTAPAHAAEGKRSFLMKLAERHQARRDFKAFLRENPDLKTYRKGAIGLKSAAIKTVAATALGGSAMYAALEAFGDGVNGVSNGFGNKGVPAMMAAGALAVGAWKGAQLVRRSANTRTVEFALKSGVAIPQQRINAWVDAKVISAPAK